ncbi:CASP-like protein 1D1 [Mercurialis annua]|uniref:CASP-like protein 1D1 n=1 Tax=Mercurialis annua TaxID=3986 RepID=UPI0024AE3A13|nr:CASP-like protein 1D1 [Mercurialis annua]
MIDIAIIKLQIRSLYFNLTFTDPLNFNFVVITPFYGWNLESVPHSPLLRVWKKMDSFHLRPALTTGKTDPEVAPLPARREYFGVDVGLSVFLFATTLIAIVVMSTAMQTKLIPVPGVPGLVLPIEAKFDNSPALIYFVAALSVACLYSIITTLTSLGVIAKPTSTAKVLFYYAIWDVLMLGIVVAATGTAGAVGYIGLKGNKHTGWRKVCNVYGTFCDHMISAVAVSLIASIVLVLLIALSIWTLYSRVRKAE